MAYFQYYVYGINVCVLTAYFVLCIFRYFLNNAQTLYPKAISSSKTTHCANWHQDCLISDALTSREILSIG